MSWEKYLEGEFFPKAHLVILSREQKQIADQNDRQFHKIFSSSPSKRYW